MKRVLALTEACLVERDPATYNIATLKPLGEVRGKPFLVLLQIEALKDNSRNLIVYIRWS